MRKKVVFCVYNLNNKNRGSSKRKKASFEELGDFPRFEKRISRGDNHFFEFKMRNI